MNKAPNFRPGGKCCINCEYGGVTSMPSYLVNCDRYGLVPPGGVCDDWEED